MTSIYTGASAQTVESAVTTPLEQQINGAEGMKYLTSSSTNDGVSSITATFELTRNPDLASVDIQNRVNTAQGRLPNAVKQVGITVQKSSQNFVFGAAVYSPDGRYPPLFMSNYLDVYVRDNLKRVPGVADVLIFGERKFSMRMWLDPAWFPALTAPMSSMRSAANVEVAAGQVVFQPAPRTGLRSASVAVAVSWKPQFAQHHPQEQQRRDTVRLKDVGRAELGAEDYA